MGVKIISVKNNFIAVLFSVSALPSWITRLKKNAQNLFPGNYPNAASWGANEISKWQAMGISIGRDGEMWLIEELSQCRGDIQWEETTKNQIRSWRQLEMFLKIELKA